MEGYGAAGELMLGLAHFHILPRGIDMENPMIMSGLRGFP